MAAVSAGQVTVSTSAVSVVAAIQTEVRTVVVKNTDATNKCAVGPAGVAAGTGHILAAGESVTVRLKAGQELYAIRTGAADVVVSYLAC
jgi:hypothetical protein